MRTYAKHPLRNLFPNKYTLADLTLSKLGLPDSTEQKIQQMRAEGKMSFGFVNNDETAMNSARIEFEVLGKIDPINDLKIMYRKEKEKTIQALVDVTQNHDNALKELIQQYPILSNTIWQVFRRTLFFDGNIPYAAMNRNLEEEEKWKKSHSVMVCTTDKEFSEVYLQDCQRLGITEKSFQIEPKYRFIEFDNDFMFGLGRYAFAKEDKDIFQTSWDIRKPEIQFFNYSRLENKTK